MDKEDLKYVNAGVLGCSESELTEGNILKEDYNFKSDYDNLVSIELQTLNKFLDKYGFEVEVVEDEDILCDIDWENSVGMFLNSIQDNASVFPIALNKNYILNNVDDKTDLVYAIRGTLWHEAGHGIFNFLSDVYELYDLDEEEVVEDFARYVEDSELYNILQQYINDDLEEQLKPKVKEDLSQEVDSEGNPLTKEQVEFFKNSKVRDKQGRLLVCYHGTTEQFDEFFGYSFFTDDYLNADGYASGEYIYEVYLNLTHPYIFDAKGKKYDNLDCEYGSSTREVISNVDAKNYDGVIFTNINDSWTDDEEGGISTVFVAFYPNQIKSIDNETPSDSNNINEELLYHGQDDDDMWDRENTLTWYTTSEKYAKQYGKKIFTKDIDLSKYNLLDLGEINDEVFDNDGNYTKEFKKFCKKIEMTPKQFEKYLKQFGWYPKYLNFIFDITSEYPFYKLLIDLGYDGVKAKEGGYDTYGLIKSDLTEDLSSKEKAQQDYEQSYNDLIGNDKTRLYRYREWANNSNNDYKEYIYNDLLNGKKEDALHYWYNHYKLFTGNYDLSYDDFLNTPITLYRATNVDEKDDATNPFFSYAQSKKLAQRFLDTTQRLYNNRTGEIEEIQIKPRDTLGMIPSDEYEIIVPNKAYQSRVDDMSSIVDNIIKYANENNVKLPYDRDYILTLFNKRDKENVSKLGAQLMNYIDKRKGNKIKESVDNKTFTFPDLRRAIDFFWQERDAKIETVPIKKLVDDNNLLNDDDLQSYHQRQWDNKKASEFSIDKSKVNSMRISEVPYAVRKKDGKLELGDGRHRTRALYNDGYEYVTLPVINESKLNSSKANLQEDKSGIKVGDEITDTQAKTFYDRGYIDILVKNDKGESKLIPAWHSNETQKELSRELVKDKKTGKDSLKITGNKVDLPKFDQVVSDIKKELGDNIKFYTQSPKSNKEYPNEIETDVQDRVTGKAYKLFKVVDGKLYPPIVKNTGAKETPTNVWIKCGSPEFVEVSASWGKPQVSKTSMGNLAFRAGWHLGELPYAPQFESRKNPGYLSSDKFVWAECEYDATINYQDRAMSYGFTKDGKFTNSAAGLPYRPVGGYYKYRTNPNPNTIAWVITGSMKVNKVLEDSEVEKICKENGVPYLKRPGGDKTLKELGLKESKLNESKTTPRIRESLLQEGKQDKENFKKWAEQAVEVAYKDRGLSDLERKGNAEYIVNWFENNRKNLKSPQNDYYYWIKEKNVQAAYDELNRLVSEQEKKKDFEKKSKDGARLIYSDSNWKVYEITTYEASVKYGANTKWCISGSKRWSNGANGRGYWNDYTSKGVKFYFFIGKDTKYAIAIYPNGTDFEIFDAQDNSIAYIPNAPIIDEIKVDYYSHNEDRLMLNLIKTGQLPNVCSLLSQYLWDSGYSINIYDKSMFDDFLQQIAEGVDEDYVKWLAVYNGLKDEEWYEEETGEKYEDEWYGDTTWYLQNDLGFLDNYATLEDALTKDNPYFNYDNNEYFISDLENVDIYCCKDWVAVWLYIRNYLDDETDLLNFIKDEISTNWGYSDFEKVGLSKEYLQGEKNIDESLDDFEYEVGKVYHGGIEKSLHKDFRSILWFTEDYDYALDFGENIFICNLNLKNTLIVGNTDGYIRGLIPTQFSTDFTRLANNLRVTPKELLKCNPEASKIYSIVRTKAFKDLCIKNGYDSVETEEFGHVCFGVFNLDQVDIVDTDFEDESTLETLSPMDESLKPRVREELLLEKGTDYKKQAVKIISNSGLFDEETSTKIIDGLFRQDIHAFNHAPAWLEKYLKGIARMLVQYCDGDKSKAQQFLTECPSEFEYYLTWVKQNREKIGNSLDDEFVNNLTYEQVKEKNNKIRDEIDAESKDELSKMKFSNSSNYTLVPIDSYDQMHKLYGGHWTGDGTDEEGEYAGNGGTSWCHTNSKNTYANWTKGGHRFFVLQHNNWKDIPFNEKTNKEMSGKDDYGNSLIAILANKYGKLNNATLRCNHVGVSSSADNQYNSYAELSKIAGFNVEEEVLKYDFEEFSTDKLFTVENGVLIRASDNYEAYRDIVEYKIPTGVKTIAKNTFYNCINLESIEIPSSVTSIGESAFESCISLTSVTFEEGSQLTSIGDYTFSYCRSLTSITISNSVTSIGNGAFIWCRSLTSITFAEGSKLTSIGEFAFYNCSSLTSITIPSSVTSIGKFAFKDCSSLTSIEIPASVESIGNYAFAECSPNLTVFTDNNYVKRYCNEYEINCSPLSEYNKS